MSSFDSPAIPSAIFVPKLAEGIVERESDEVTSIKGATAEQRRAIEAAQSRVFGTKRGHQMVERLKKDERTIEIRVNHIGVNSSPAPGYHINLDPNDLGTVLTKSGPTPVTLERALSHEFGHAIFGDSDAAPGRLLNILRNENPIMRELGEPPRIKY